MPEEEITEEEVVPEGTSEALVRVRDLEDLFRYSSSVPTHTPRTFREQFVLYESGTTRRLYVYINETWVALSYVDGSLYIEKDGSIDFTGDQSMGTHKLTNVVDPASNQDAATKKYVDDHKGIVMLHKDTVESSTTALTETVVKTYTMPGGTLGTTGGVRITILGEAHGLGAYDSVIKFYFGSHLILSKDMLFANDAFKLEYTVINQSDDNAQRISGVYSTQEDTDVYHTVEYYKSVAGTVDTSANVIIKLSGLRHTDNASGYVKVYLFLVENI